MIFRQQFVRRTGSRFISSGLVTLLSILLLSNSTSLFSLPVVGQSQPQVVATNPPRAAKVVLIAARGAADWRMDAYLASGVLPPTGGFARLLRAGASAETLSPIEGALTAVSAASFITGAYPERHGIVANSFHKQGDPLGSETNGMSSYLQAETLVEAALRQGKRVINLAPINANGSQPHLSGDWTLLSGEQLSAGKVVTLNPTDQPAWNPDRESFEHWQALGTAQPQQLSVQATGLPSIELHALAVDSIFDGQRRYDSVIVDTDGEARNGTAAQLRVRQWSPFELAGQPDRAGLWFKLLALPEDLRGVRLYVGAAHKNQGRPQEFVETVNRELGFWPGNIDIPNWQQRLIDEQTLFEQAERLAEYKRALTLLCLRQFPCDLLILDENLIDNLSHQFLLTDPRQPDYHAEDGARRARYARYVERTYQIVDATLGHIMDAASAETAVVVASPHGMMASHTAIAVNAALARAGFRVREDDKAEIRAYAYAALAHIRINLRGRDPQGVVAPRQLSRYVERIVATCRNLRDANGELVFDRVLRRAELSGLRLGHPSHVGDVVLLARPGYFLSNSFSASGVKPRFLSDHGYLSNNREMQGVFFAAGPGIRQQVLPALRTVDIAPTVSALLGIRPPLHNQGRDVFQ